MATVRLRIDDFEDGLLPGICSSSGADGARLYRIAVSSRMPGWLWLAVFGGPVGIFAAFVLSGVLRKTAYGYVPYTDEVHNRLRARARRSAQGLATCIAVFCGSFVLSWAGPFSGGGGFRGIAFLLAVGAFVVGLVCAFFWANVPGSVGGFLDSTTRWVELGPVSERFALAYEQQEADRRQARRDEVIGTRLDR